MKDHQWFEDRLPQYTAGSLAENQLAGDQHQEVGRHIESCLKCQADLRLWSALSVEIRAQNDQLVLPESVGEAVLQQIRAERSQREAGMLPAWRQAIQRDIDLLRIQAPLVRPELWPASAVVVLIGVAVAYLLGNSLVIRLLAPMVAAASLAVLYGPENDPATELVLSCPTSPRQILLARAALVFGYNLILALIASLVSKSLVPPGLFGALILSWLGPMAFLSFAALLLSLWIGANNAITLTYLAWIAQYLPDLQLPVVAGWQRWLAPLAQAYQQFWANPALLLASACLMLGLALWSTGRLERQLPHWI
jgi:anti-sigma factor RsiW